MGKKIVIELQGYRRRKKNDQTPPEAVYNPELHTEGFKTLREQAVFRFTCRKCRDAPCIAVCPANALEKNTEGVVTRAVNLCISCKSCVVICPFGTLMTDFFRFKKDKSGIFNISDEKSLEIFLEKSSSGEVEVYSNDQNPDKNLFTLNDRVLVREDVWDPDKL